MPLLLKHGSWSLTLGASLAQVLGASLVIVYNVVVRAALVASPPMSDVMSRASKFYALAAIIAGFLIGRRQAFGLDSASPIIPAGKSFILQNSLLQQSFIKGVQKMYLITKLKMAIVCVCLSLPLTIPLSNYIFAAGEQPIVKNVISSIKKT